MPATLQGDNVADLVTTTLRDLGRMKWTEIASSLQDYVALPKILKKEKVQFDSGYGIQWNVLVNQSGAAANVGLYGKDTVNVVDGMQTANIPWRHTTTNYAFERREIAMNRDPAKIVDLVKTRRGMAMISLAEVLETDLWSKPTDSNDQTAPFGMPYWMVKSASAGFNGTNPAGFSSGAGNLSSSTYPNWANYTDNYVNMNKSDLVAKMRAAATKTNFKSPIDLPSYNRGDRYGMYTTYAVVAALETLAEQQNDTLGNDVASKDGQVMFRKNPITWVPKLESDTTNPVYGINWGVLYPVFLKGEYLREDPPEKVAGQHTVYQVFVDLTWNLKCSDRRRLWLITQ